MQQLSASSFGPVLDPDPVDRLELIRKGTEILTEFGAESGGFITVEQKAQHLNICMVALADCVSSLSADLYAQDREAFNRIHGEAERYMHHIEAMLIDFSLSVEEDYRPPTFAHVVLATIFSFVSDKMNNIKRGFLKNAHDRQARLRAVGEYRARVVVYREKIEAITDAQIIIKQKELLANNQEYQNVCRELIQNENAERSNYSRREELRDLKKKMKADAHDEAVRLLSSRVYLAP